MDTNRKDKTAWANPSPDGTMATFTGPRGYSIWASPHEKTEPETAYHVQVLCNTRSRIDCGTAFINSSCRDKERAIARHAARSITEKMHGVNPSRIRHLAEALADIKETAFAETDGGTAEALQCLDNNMLRSISEKLATQAAEYRRLAESLDVAHRAVSDAASAGAGEKGVQDHA